MPTLTLDEYAQLLKEQARKLSQYTVPKLKVKAPEELKPVDVKPTVVEKRTPVEKVIPVPETLPPPVSVVASATGEVTTPDLTEPEKLEKAYMDGLREELKQAIALYREKRGEDPPIFTDALAVIEHPKEPGAWCQRGFTSTQCAMLNSDMLLSLVHTAYNNILLAEDMIRGVKQWKLWKEGKPSNRRIPPSELGPFGYYLIGEKPPWESS